ncbi:MAG: DUF1579 family protein [Gaiellaceae bacterium]
MATATANVPHPISAGQETLALQRFFRDCTWTGTIVEGGMGPGAPAMTAEGRGVHKAIHGGLWIVGDYEQDQFLLDGTFVLKWQLHWVVGWDPDAGEYRGTHADNYGHAGVMRGRLEGDVLTFETMGDTAVRQRMIWSLADPAVMRWRNEISFGGGPFSLVEEYEYTFTGDRTS